MRNLVREISIDRKYFRYDDPTKIKIKAGYYEDDSSDFGLVRILQITIIDSQYNEEKPEYYDMSFNCEHLKEQKDGTVLAIGIEGLEISLSLN